MGNSVEGKRDPGLILVKEGCVLRYEAEITPHRKLKSEAGSGKLRGQSSIATATRSDATNAASQGFWRGESKEEKAGGCMSWFCQLGWVRPRQGARTWRGVGGMSAIVAQALRQEAPGCSTKLWSRRSRESHHSIVLDSAQVELADVPVQRGSGELKLGRIW